MGKRRTTVTPRRYCEVRSERKLACLSDWDAFDTAIQPPRICPACDRRTLVGLVFGMPGPDLVAAAEHGEVVLAGCCIEPGLACDAPTMTCTSCDWTGFEAYDRLFEQNDLVGVMNAHAQRGSGLFLRGAGLGFFVVDDRLPPGWAEMLTTMETAFRALIEHAATVHDVAGDGDVGVGWFDHPLLGHPLAEHIGLRHEAEQCLQVMREQLVGLALAVIGSYASSGDAVTVEMADRAASGVVSDHLDDAAVAIETVHAATLEAFRVELAGTVCGLVMMHDKVVTLTSHSGDHLHFGWRSDPVGEWALALWQDGHEPVRTWDDPLHAGEVVDEIVERLDLDDEQPVATVKVRPLASLFARR